MAYDQKESPLEQQRRVLDTMLDLFDLPSPHGDFEQLIVLRDPPSGLRALIALHDTSRGPGFGGIRRLIYATPNDALKDVLNLAAAMSEKCQRAELPAGGAKTVVLDHPGLDRPAAYAALGRAIEELGGRYIAGPDVGTSAAELNVLRRHTHFVNPPQNQPGASTAQGVLASLRGALRVLSTEHANAPHTFLVQGLGDVGLRVALALHAGGARVLATELDAHRAAAAQVQGIELIAAQDALTTPCDVFVPCALGGALTKAVAERLSCRLVCGSANNILESPSVAEVLARRGILFVPDVLSSAGAVIEGVFTYTDGDSPEIRARIHERIEACAARVQGYLRSH